MTMGITKRDKVLLTLMGMAAILVFFMAVLIMPLERSRLSVRHQMIENQSRIGEVEVKLDRLESSRAELADNREELDRSQSRFYPLMKSHEIDRILVEKLKEYGITAREMRITLADEASDIPSFLADGKPGSNPQHDPAGIYLAAATMRVEGTMTNLDLLLDELTGNMPGIWVTSLQWKPVSESVLDNWSLEMELQIGMSEQE